MDKKDIPEQYQAIVADARAQANKWLDRHMDKVAACDPEVLMKAYLYYASQRDAGNIKFTDKTHAEQLRNLEVAACRMFMDRMLAREKRS